MTTNKVKQELCKMLTLKALPEIERAIKPRSNSHCKYNGRKPNNTTFMKNWTKYNKNIDNCLKKAIDATTKMLGPYKMFCYSLQIAKKDMNQGSPLVKAMKYQRVVDQLNMIVNLLDQASSISNKKQSDPKRQGNYDNYKHDVCHKCDLLLGCRHFWALNFFGHYTFMHTWL